jgi:hypothetical protein
MSEEPSSKGDLYDKLKSRPRHFQFSLRQLLLATGCFAVAFSGAAWFVPAMNATESGGSEEWERFFFALLFGWPMLVLGLGAGIGILCNRLWWVLLFASAIMCALYVAVFGSIGMR